MRAPKTAPDGFVIYRETLELIKLLPDTSAGKVFKAAAEMFDTGAAPETLDLSETLAFTLVRRDIAKAYTHHEEVCERNRRIATNRRQRSPVVTSGNDSSQLDTKNTEPEQEPEQELELEQEQKKGDKRPRFSPPSLDEVITYCQERKNTVDPQAFVDFYSSKGWKIGREPMKDWRAAVRTWERRQTEDGNSRGDHTGVQGRYEERFTGLYDVS